MSFCPLVLRQYVILLELGVRQLVTQHCCLGRKQNTLIKVHLDCNKKSLSVAKKGQNICS